MIQIRKSVFETNSSSTHSISIESGDVKLYSNINHNGIIVLSGGQFGWEEETYNDPMTKANYCAQDWFEDNQKMEMLVEVIKNHTLADEVIFDLESLNDGFVDHQSSGTSIEAFDSHEKLRDFIFNWDSVLTTDNDNH